MMRNMREKPPEPMTMTSTFAWDGRSLSQRRCSSETDFSETDLLAIGFPPFDILGLNTVSMLLVRPACRGVVGGGQSDRAAAAADDVEVRAGGRRRDGLTRLALGCRVYRHGLSPFFRNRDKCPRRRAAEESLLVVYPAPVHSPI